MPMLNDEDDTPRSPDADDFKEPEQEWRRRLQEEREADIERMSD